MPQIAPLQPGDPTRLGPFVLSGRLGEGGQGVVYYGQDETGERAAVKLLHVKFSGEATARIRFARELRAAQRVASFCTARVLAADLEGDTPYIASEFIDGRSLSEAVEADGPMTGSRLVRLAVGTATALTAIHQAGIVHRDFKPDNVLLAADGPRVVDFGIARILDSTATITSRAIGTPAYMAPEQISGGKVGPPADVFSWASTIAYAATGDVVFGGSSIAVVLNRVLNHDIDTGMLPEPLGGVVRACLRKSPDERPTADQILLRLLGRAASDDASAVVLSEGAAHAADPDATRLARTRPRRPMPSTDTDALRTVPTDTGALSTGTGSWIKTGAWLGIDAWNGARTGEGGDTGTGEPTGESRPSVSLSGPTGSRPTGSGSTGSGPGDSGPGDSGPTGSGTAGPGSGRGSRDGGDQAGHGGDGSSAAGPAPAGPAASEAVAAGPVVTGPALTASAVTASAVTGAAVTEAAVTGAAVTEAAVTETTVPGPAVSGPVTTGPAAPGAATTGAAPAGTPPTRRRRKGLIAGVLAAVLAILAAGGTMIAGRTGFPFGDASADGDSGDAVASAGPSPTYGSVYEKALKTGQLTIGVRWDVPGVGLEQANGLFSGFEVEIATAIAKSMKVPPQGITFRSIGVNDRARALATGDVDMVVATYSYDDNRDDAVTFAGPYYTAHADVLVLAGSHIKKLEDLSGRRMCAPLGSGTARLVADRVDVEQVPVNDYAQCMNLLTRGKVDAVPGDDLIIAGFADRVVSLKLSVLGLRLTNEHYAVGLPKGDVRTCRVVEDAISRMYADGSMLKLLRKHFGNVDFDPERTIPPKIACR